MRVLYIFLLSVSSIWCFASEKEAVVIEVRKKVKLHKTEVVYPDYFISGGGKLGLDKGALVSVVRRVPVHDPFQNASIGDFRIKVADVEIIHSDRDKSIARLVGVDRTASVHGTLRRRDGGRSIRSGDITTKSGANRTVPATGEWESVPSLSKAG